MKHMLDVKIPTVQKSQPPGGRSWHVPLQASLSPRALLHTAFFLLYSEHGSHQ